MKFYEAFDNVCETHGIKNVELSRATGISESTVSRFRNGKRDMDVNSLETLLNALTPLQRNEYFTLLQINNCDTEQVAVVLGAVAGWLRTSYPATHPQDSVVMAATR